MKLMTVAAATIIFILTAAAFAQGFASPGRMLPAWDYKQGLSPGPGGFDVLKPLQGITSVDYLGKIRRDFSLPGMSSMFPGTWLHSAINTSDTADYLGFKYSRSGGSPQSGGLYYSGEQYGGRKIYIDTGLNHAPVPDVIYLKDGNQFTAYSIQDRPPVYAYVRYSAYNRNESVGFGLANNGGSRIELMNAAPYVIQRNEGGNWKTVFSPVAAQVITPLENGTTKEWQWDQAPDQGVAAQTGDYRVLIDDRYAVQFRISTDVPAVERTDVSYDLPGLETAISSTTFMAFAQDYGTSLTREDTISLMQFKAAALGLDPEKLRAAIDAAAGSDVPCLAVHAWFQGQPAWIIAFCPGENAAAKAGVYAVDEASDRILYQG